MSLEEFTSAESFNSELRERLYNPAAAAEATRLAEKNLQENGPFDAQKLEEYIKDNPLLLYLHLTATILKD